jgi:hypothetical protein
MQNTVRQRPVLSVCMQRQRLVQILDMRVLLDGVPMSAHEPLGGQQALDADRAPRVDAGGGNADLRPETEAETVGEARAGVVEHAGGVHAAQEVFCSRCVLCAKTSHGLADDTSKIQKVRHIRSRVGIEKARDDVVVRSAHAPQEILCSSRVLCT